MNLVRFYNSTADNEKNIYCLHAAYMPSHAWANAKQPTASPDRQDPGRDPVCPVNYSRHGRELS
jgi:hypothetical protein